MTKIVPRYVKNSHSVLQDLKKIGQLPSTALLATCDAVSMYSNINTVKGLCAIQNFFKLYYNEIIASYSIDDTFNPRLIMDILELVMSKNMFKFGNTWWRQIAGTACACIYATLFFSYFERTKILKKYKENIIYYGRHIDDIF